MVDIALLVALCVIAYLVAAEGAWGAASTAIACVIAGLVATNAFEPLVETLGSSVASSYQWQNRWDVVAFLGLFAGVLTLLRLAAEKLQPTDLQVDAKVYEVVRWLGGAGAGYVVVMVLAVALHLAPLGRNYGGFVPEQKRLLGTASPDYQWLGYVQRMSRTALRTSDESGDAVVFDGATYRLSPQQDPAVFPDFPIRYAARRAEYASGTASSAGSAPRGLPNPNAKTRPTGKGF